VAAALVGGAILGAAAVAAASKPNPPMQAMPAQQGAFQLPYQFKAHNTVVVRSNYGKHLRVHPQNLMAAEGLGGTGHYAQWRVHLDGMGVVKLQSAKSGKYLRITAQSLVDVGGTGGALTRFRFHHHQHPHGVKLQSCQFPNKWIAIMPDGRVLAGAGGQHCKVTFWRGGRAQQPPVVYQPANVQPTVIVQNPAPSPVVIQQQAQQAQMQQQMEQMKIAHEAQLAQQRQQMEMEKAKMQQDIEAQQAALAAQQQMVLESQNAILQQQQAMMAQQNSNPPMQSNVAVSPMAQPPVQQMVIPQEVQQEGVSGQVPVNPYYGNSASPPNAMNTNAPPSYPELQQPVSGPPVAAAAEEKEPEPVPTMGQEQAGKVKEWLAALNMDRYYGHFIKNGYDTLERVGTITAENLKEMGCALGHIETIMAASVLAPFQDKMVRIQSMQYGTWLVERERATDSRCKLEHAKSGEGARCWMVEVLENGTFKLKHVPSKTYLRMIKVEGDVDTRSPFVGKNSTLRLVREKEGVYFIKRADEDCYLRFEEPRMVGRNKVVAVSMPMNVGRIRIICD